MNIGFLGLGKMGAALAARLETPDATLHVYDPVASSTAEFAARGCVVHAAARSVADASTIVFACLPDARVSRLVAAEIADGTMMKTYVEMSTIGRHALREIATLLKLHAIDLVDAPVSGGPGAARDGTLTVMAAGNSAVLERVRPLLAQMAGSVFCVGEVPGLAQTMKLINNVIAAASVVTVMEGLLLGAKLGLDGKTMVDVLNASSGQTNVTRVLLPNYVLKGREFGATIATMLKDLELGLTELTDLDLPRSVMSAAAERWRSAREQTDGDITRVIDLWETAAGVRLQKVEVQTGAK